MKVLFNELAQYEFEDTIEFYELEYLGLGERFKEEIKASIKRIVEYPNSDEPKPKGDYPQITQISQIKDNRFRDFICVICEICGHKSLLSCSKNFTGKILKPVSILDRIDFV